MSFKIGDWVRIKKEDYNKPSNLYGYMKGDVFKIGYISGTIQRPSSIQYWEDRDCSRGFFEEELESALLPINKHETKFKVGDEVEVTGSFDKGARSKVTGIEKSAYPNKGAWYYRLDGRLGQYESELKLVEKDSKFKVGDRVKAKYSSNPDTIYTVGKVQHSSSGIDYYYSRSEKDGGIHGYLGPEGQLTKVEEDPKPKVGDKVRVTKTVVEEGVVDFASHGENGYFEYHSQNPKQFHRFYYARGADQKVEILESKPNYPEWRLGHVVKNAQGRLYTCNGQQFFDLFGKPRSIDDLEARGPLTIVSEPVKE